MLIRTISFNMISTLVKINTELPQDIFQKQNKTKNAVFLDPAILFTFQSWDKIATRHTCAQTDALILKIPDVFREKHAIVLSVTLFCNPVPVITLDIKRIPIGSRPIREWKRWIDCFLVSSPCNDGGKTVRAACQWPHIPAAEDTHQCKPVKQLCVQNRIELFHSFYCSMMVSNRNGVLSLQVFKTSYKFTLPQMKALNQSRKSWNWMLHASLKQLMHSSVFSL